MEAELRQTVTGDGARLRAAHREVVFSVEQAAKALVYVSAVARDAAAAIRDAQACRVELHHAATTAQRALLADRRDAAVRRLNNAIDESDAVGADLINLRAGVVRFRALYQGRPVSLTWRVGDDVRSAWACLRTQVGGEEPVEIDETAEAGDASAGDVPMATNPCVRAYAAA